MHVKKYQMKNRTDLTEEPKVPQHPQLLLNKGKFCTTPQSGAKKLTGTLFLNPREGGGKSPKSGPTARQNQICHPQIMPENSCLSKKTSTHSKLMMRLSHQMIRTREDERKRVAQDLHDQVISTPSRTRFPAH